MSFRLRWRFLVAIRTFGLVFSMAVAAAAFAVEQPSNTALRANPPQDDIAVALESPDQRIVRPLQAIETTRTV